MYITCNHLKKGDGILMIDKIVDIGYEENERHGAGAENVWRHGMCGGHGPITGIPKTRPTTSEHKD